MDIPVIVGIAAAAIVTTKLALRRFDHREGIRSMPRIFRDRLLSDFSLAPVAVAGYRCRVKRGRFARTSVRYIEVFDPARRQAAGAPASATHDAATDRAAMVFEGRMWTDDVMYIEDRREGQPVFVREG